MVGLIRSLSELEVDAVYTDRLSRGVKLTTLPGWQLGIAENQDRIAHVDAGDHSQARRLAGIREGLFMRFLRVMDMLFSNLDASRMEIRQIEFDADAWGHRHPR